MIAMVRHRPARLAHALALGSLVLALGCARRSVDGERARATPADEGDGSLGLGPTLDEGDPAPLGGASPSGSTAPRPPATIYRAELERATERGPAYLLRQLGPEPFQHHGMWVGWEITQLFPDDPGLCTPGCDVELGDVILSVNGSTLETPQAFAEALAALPKADRLVVHSLRDGKRRERSYRIVDGDGVGAHPDAGAR